MRGRGVLRRARFAGSWYPGHADALRQKVSGYVSGCVEASDAWALISPHAGMEYSGPIAGKGFASVNVPQSVVVLAPAHHWGVPPIAVWDGDAWETPLGSVLIDTDLRAAIMAGCPSAEGNADGHLAEHSIELQLPFLQLRRPDVKIVPVLVATADADTLKELGRACAEAIRSSDEWPLIVASSDMTHYESAESARKKDDRALARVKGLDPDGLLEVVRNERISMCGVAPVAAMLFAVMALGSARAEIVAYGTSGDVTGDRSEVVAYAAVAVRGGAN
jgi:AmmeMemoRadiSam system protein B